MMRQMQSCLGNTKLVKSLTSQLNVTGQRNVHYEVLCKCEAGLYFSVFSVLKLWDGMQKQSMYYAMRALQLLPSSAFSYSIARSQTDEIIRKFQVVEIFGYDLRKSEHSLTRPFDTDQTKIVGHHVGVNAARKIVQEYGVSYNLYPGLRSLPRALLYMNAAHCPDAGYNRKIMSNVMRPIVSTPLRLISKSQQVGQLFLKEKELQSIVCPVPMRNFFVTGSSVLADQVSKEYPEIYIQNEVTAAQN